MISLDEISILSRNIGKQKVVFNMLMLSLLEGDNPIIKFPSEEAAKRFFDYMDGL